MVVFFFQAEDGIRDLVRSRGLGDVYKRQHDAGRAENQTDHYDPCLSQILCHWSANRCNGQQRGRQLLPRRLPQQWYLRRSCLLYTSDAADERSSVDLGGRRIIKKKNSAVLDRGT